MTLWAFAPGSQAMTSTGASGTADALLQAHIHCTQWPAVSPTHNHPLSLIFPPFNSQT